MSLTDEYYAAKKKRKEKQTSPDTKAKSESKTDDLTSSYYSAKEARKSESNHFNDDIAPTLSWLDIEKARQERAEKERTYAPKSAWYDENIKDTVVINEVARELVSPKEDLRSKEVPLGMSKIPESVWEGIEQQQSWSDLFSLSGVDSLPKDKKAVLEKYLPKKSSPTIIKNPFGDIVVDTEIPDQKINAPQLDERIAAYEAIENKTQKDWEELEELYGYRAVSQGRHYLLPTEKRPMFDENGNYMHKTDGQLMTEWIGNSVASGIANFGQGVVSTVDFLIPTELFLEDEDDPFSIADEEAKKVAQSVSEAAYEAAENLGGGGWHTGSQIISTVVEMLPTLALAYASGGTSTAASGGGVLKAGGMLSGGSKLADAGRLVVNGIKTVGKNPQFWMSMARELGNDYDEAIENGATPLEATYYSLVTSTTNSLIELGGIEDLPKNIEKGKPLLDWVKSSLKEGVVEEPLQRVTSKAFAKFIYDEDAPIISSTDESAIINPKEMAKEGMIATAAAAVIGSPVAVTSTVDKVSSAVDKVVSNTETKKTPKKTLTAAEEKVANKLVEDAVAEKESDGTKLKDKEKNEIRDNIVEQMQKGAIDIDTIESVLGGESYEAYKGAVDENTALKQELDELNNIKASDLTGKQSDRLAELKAMGLDDTSKIDGLKKTVSDEVLNIVANDGKGKGSMLQESYREKERRSQTFTADLSQYKGKQKETVERAINSGVVNNTNRAHEMVDTLSKIEAKKGIVFDFADNKKLKEWGVALEGKTVNGFVNDGKVTLNMESAKAWEFVVGHEVGHVVKNTGDEYKKFQQELFKYAESKGELESRRAELTKLYEGTNADIDEELTNDLIGDYLFSDEKFVKHLTSDRNVFQKVYDEIKYLWNVATGKEKAQIEKVKKQFDKVWKELGEGTQTSEGLKYSVSAETDTEYMSAVERGDTETAQRLVNEAAARLGYTPNSEYRGNHYAPYATIGKGDFVDLDKLQELCDEGSDLNLYAIANGISVQPDDYFGTNGARWYGYDDAEGMESYRAIKSAMASIQRQMEQYGEVREMPTIKVYRAVPKSVKETKLQSGGQWVTPSYLYAQSHGEHSLDGKYKIIEETVSAENLWWDGNDIREWGFDDGTDYAYRDTKNNRKLLAPVTYDDEGNVIPLSKRFNFRNADERYSISPEGEVSTNGTPLKDLYLAPVREDVAPVDVSKKETTTTETFPDDYSPATAEEVDALNKESFDHFTDEDMPPETIQYGDNLPDNISLDTKSLKQLTKVIGDKIPLSDKFAKADLENVIQRFSKGEITTKEELFAEIKKKFGVEYQKQRDDFVANLKSSVKNQRVNVSEDIKRDMGEKWGEFFRKHFGQIRFSKEGIAVDQFYQALNYTYPNVFPDDVINPTDQLEKIGEFVKTPVNAVIAQPIDDGTLRDVTDFIYETVAVYKDTVRFTNALEMEDAPIDESLAPPVEEVAEDFAPDVETATDSNENVADKVYSALSNGIRKVNGKTIYITRDSWNDGATITIKDADGTKSKFRVDKGRYLTNEQLWRKAANIVAGANKVDAKNITNEAPMREAEMSDKDVTPVAKSGLEARIEKINQQLEADKVSLAQDFAKRKGEMEKSLSDPYALQNKAYELYNEVLGMRKGQRVSKELAYLLDNLDLSAEHKAESYNRLKTALLHTYHSPTQVADWGTISPIEVRVRETIGRWFEDLRNEYNNITNKYQLDVEKLEKDAEEQRKVARRANQRKIKMQEHKDFAKNLLGDFSKWVDKKLGLQYATNTEHRNLRDIVRDENGNKDIAHADAINDALNGRYNREHAELNRELAQIRKKYADLKITKAEDAYIQMLGEFRHNPDTTLTKEVVDEYLKKHRKKIDEAKVDKIIEMARQDYDNLITRLNEVLREQGMKEIPYRQGYFPHFTDTKQNFVQKLLNWKTQDNEIPTSIAGLTEDFRPNKSYQSFDKHRYGDKTDFSFKKGFDAYSSGALDWIYHMDTIQKRRAVENELRTAFADEGIKEKIKAVYENEEYDADKAQAEIEQILSVSNAHLSHFVQDFTTHTNILANKKNSLDRTIEQMTNRNVYSVMQNVQNRMSANMVLANVSSAMTNFIPITQATAQVSPLRMLQATKDTIANAIKDDGMINKSAFLTNRLRNADNLHRTNWDKTLDYAGIGFEVIDNIAAQVIWRGKYNQNLARGMSEAEAIANADQFAENVMAGRSKGNEPTLFNAKNPIVKAFTMFQLEVNNQYGYFLKDVPNDLKAETNHWKLNLAKGYTTAFIGAYVYNALFQALAGREPALDPIGIIEDLLRDLFDEEKETSEVITNLGDNIIEELPFVGGLFGGGRIPISSAMPYGGEYGGGWKAAVEDISEGNWGNVGKEMMNPLLNIGLPVGGGQIKKTVQGLKMFNTDEEHPVTGSYTDSGELRFPVEDTPLNRIQAGVFGQYANENAREYFDNDYAPLNEKQIQEYMDVDMPITDYWDYREGLNDLAPLDGKESVTLNQKGDYVGGLDLPVDKKNILINNLTDRETPIDMTGYEDFGDFEEFDFAMRYPEKYQILQEQGISVKDYKENYEETAFIHTDAFSTASDNMGKYTVSKAITDDYMQYDYYKSEINKFKGDGAKERKRAYIFSLDELDYGQQVVLYRSMFDSQKDREEFDADVYYYISTHNGLTFEEKKTIFEELGFEIEGNNVKW